MIYFTHDAIIHDVALGFLSGISRDPATAYGYKGYYVSTTKKIINYLNLNIYKCSWG